MTNEKIFGAFESFSERVVDQLLENEFNGLDDDGPDYIDDGENRERVKKLLCVHLMENQR